MVLYCTVLSCAVLSCAVLCCDLLFCGLYISAAHQSVCLCVCVCVFVCVSAPPLPSPPTSYHLSRSYILTHPPLKAPTMTTTRSTEKGTSSQGSMLESQRCTFFRTPRRLKFRPILRTRTLIPSCTTTTECMTERGIRHTSRY